MSQKPYEAILKNLNSESDIENLANETKECFFLDYKQTEKDDYTQSRSIKGNDLDNIAKSISGFGNALGGILIFGVDNNKKLKPFVGHETFETLVQESVSRSTNPHHERVETKSISSKNEKGYVIIIIHQSHNRPLQVITNSNTHRYFYRTGESHVDIPHDVLVGMMGKRIPVSISCQFQITQTSDTAQNAFEFNFLLRNNSSVIARDVWFNMDVGVPNVSVKQGASFNLFAGHKMSNSMSVITIKDYRLPPQGYVSPIGLSIPRTRLKDEQEYQIYFTYGCDGSKMNEFDSIFTGREFNALLDKNVRGLIELLKQKSKGFVERI